MVFHFNVTGVERKALVEKISEILGIKAKYLKVPSCAYQIGDYHVSKDGILSWDDTDEESLDNMERGCDLIMKLETAGFISEEKESFERRESPELQVTSEETEPEITQEADEPAIGMSEDEKGLEMNGTTISVPVTMFDGPALENLRRLVRNKSELLKRAFQTDELVIEVDEEKVRFPWFPEVADPDETAAYTLFIQKFCEMAIRQKRINLTTTEIVNEKYEFRCFLLRLGMIGKDCKVQRKILMRNLSGSAAFKSGSRKEA